MWTVFHFSEELGLAHSRHWWAVQNIRDSSQPIFQTADKEGAIKLATLMNVEAVHFGPEFLRPVATRRISVPLDAVTVELMDAASAVMGALEQHGPSIVPHLLDGDENAGQRLRDAIARAQRTVRASTAHHVPQQES